MNFKNMYGSGRTPAGNLPSLARQPSIYSLTFEEFQNTIGGPGKDFGSMNMDEFLKNIWTVEEMQAMAASFDGGAGLLGSGGGGGGGSVPFQRQGSLTLPRTLSKKTVDDVWRDISRDKVGNENMAPTLQQRQQTLGEMTLEKFLVKAGVVREDAKCTANVSPSNAAGGFYGEFPFPNSNAGLSLGFQQRGQSNGVMANPGPENYHQIPPNPSSNMAVKVNGGRPSQHHLFPKQDNVGFEPSVQLGNNIESLNQGMQNSVAGGGDPAMNNGFLQSGRGGGLQGGGGMGMVGVGAGAVGVTVESPRNLLSSDRIGKGNGNASSVSPVQYDFNGGIRGRKGGGTLEKAIESRQKRMIKNRESAARSRARKQAYTSELEAEVAILKDENNALQKKQATILEMHKKLVLEIINMQRGPKKRCLRRTLTGPW